MRFFYTFPAMLLASTSYSYAQAQENACLSSHEKSQARVQEIQERYDPQIREMSEKYKTQAEGLKETAPNPDNAAEAAIGFDFDVTWHDEEIIFHLPEVTMKDQNISLDLPQVTMNDQEWFIETPQFFMGTECTAGVPELVCGWELTDIGFGVKTDMWVCSMRTGSDICLDVPQVTMVSERIVIGIPEFTVDRTDFIMGIPEVTMEEQRIIVSIPRFELKNVSIDANSMQDAARKLRDDAAVESAQISSNYQAAVEQENVRGVQDVFSCSIKNLETLRDQSFVQIDGNIEIFTAALQKSREVGATDMSLRMENSVNDLIARRSEMSINFQKQIADLVTKMEAAMRSTATDAITISVAPPGVEAVSGDDI